MTKLDAEFAIVLSSKRLVTFIFGNPASRVIWMKVIRDKCHIIPLMSIWMLTDETWHRWKNIAVYRAKSIELDILVQEFDI